MIRTKNGMDIHTISNLAEADSILRSIYESTSLSKQEICKLISFEGLSLADNVRCYNKFIREEGKVLDYASPIVRAA